MHKFSNFKIDSDFVTRVIREDANDIDLFVDLDYRTLDILLESNNFILSRLQFISVRSLIIRLSKNNYLATIHIMKDIDLHSSVANFEIGYLDSILSIKLLDNKAILTKITRK